MNDMEFEQRATANPFDETSEFLAAVLEKPERQAMLDELKAFETKMKATLHTVNATDELKQRLLNIPKTDLALDDVAANDSQFWTKKLLPIAASLLIAVGLVFTYWPAQQSELGLEVFTHIYDESPFLEVESLMAMSEVNQKMTNTLKLDFKESAELDIHVTSDCIVAKEDAIHMVMEGDVGPITVIVIPNSPVAEEYSISDERFEGIVIPTPSGNMVVVGEKNENIFEFSNMLASNINW